MRERLVAAMVGLAIAAIVLLTIPRTYMLAGLVQDQEQRLVDHSATLVASVLTERERSGSEVDASSLDALRENDEVIIYRPADSDAVRVGGEVAAHDVIAERQVPGGGRVTVARSGDEVRARVLEALVPLLLTGLLLIGGAAAVGWWIARRIARPFAELAEVADTLGAGRFDTTVRRFRIPEAEKIAAALRSSSTQLEALVARERSFAANASHQLRTPITALRLTVEDVSQWDETPGTVAAELAAVLPEFDRLSEAIDDLLGMSRGQRVQERTEVDLGALATEAVERWRPLVESGGRSIEVRVPVPVTARTAAGPVSQVLDVLVENASSHGEGNIRVSVLEREHVVLVLVSDQGTRGMDREVFSRGVRGQSSPGHGLGLTIAAELAASLGGYLALAEGTPTRFVLMLPGHGVDAVEPTTRFDADL